MLGAEQSVLVHRLSKFSGYKKDKLKTMKHLLADYHGFKILRDAVAVIEMHVLSLSDGGDHMIALCDVVSHKNLTDTDVLTLDHLRAEKLIAI
jgi:flavin reductase (DIM6/NTAB) family NADH-FMN oxidoreductase RutF